MERYDKDAQQMEQRSGRAEHSRRSGESGHQETGKAERNDSRSRGGDRSASFGSADQSRRSGEESATEVGKAVKPGR